MERLLEPLSVSGPTMHRTRSVLIYHKPNIGLSG